MFNSKAVSSIRLIALSMIITCHIFQGKDIVLAWWFNVGVQIFLFMSGFLYGTKDIKDASSWFKKRFSKILTPYYLLLIIVIIFYTVFARNLLNIKGMLVNILVLQGFGTGLPGIEHLWFLSYILMCYLITPVLQSIDCASLKNKRGVYIWKLILILALLQLFNYIGVLNMSIPNISAYIIGYYFSRRHFSYEGYKGLAQNVSLKKSVTGIFTACIITTPLVIYLEYFSKGGILWFLEPYTDFLFGWNHTLLGITLFLAMYFIFEHLYSRIENKTINSIISWSDRYSYQVYLTHQIVILGQFSWLALTGSMFVNIILIIIFAVTTGVILQKLECFTKNQLNIKRKQKLTA